LLVRTNCPWLRPVFVRTSCARWIASAAARSTVSDTTDLREGVCAVTEVGAGCDGHGSVVRARLTNCVRHFQAPARRLAFQAANRDESRGENHERRCADCRSASLTRRPNRSSPRAVAVPRRRAISGPSARPRAVGTTAATSSAARLEVASIGHCRHSGAARLGSTRNDGAENRGAHACHAKIARRANLSHVLGVALSGKSKRCSRLSRSHKRGASRSSRT
jgi:hypothetical protein